MALCGGDGGKGSLTAGLCWPVETSHTNKGTILSQVLMGRDVKQQAELEGHIGSVEVGPPSLALLLLEEVGLGLRVFLSHQQGPGDRSRWW